jgi:glutathione S-transferase
MIRLHCSLLSTFSRRVRIALLEKDIGHELVVIDMAAGAHKRPEYLALNPYGRVPVLEQDGFVLYESTAILRYLDSLKPEPSLFPHAARERALVDMHMKLCDLEFTRYAGAILFSKRFLPKERWDLAAFEQARKPMERHLTILARQLGDRDYLVGDRFTAADLVYTPHLQFLPLLEIDTPVAIAAWAKRLLARRSAATTAPDR